MFQHTVSNCSWRRKAPFNRLTEKNISNACGIQRNTHCNTYSCTSYKPNKAGTAICQSKFFRIRAISFKSLLAETWRTFRIHTFAVKRTILLAHQLQARRRVNQLSYLQVITQRPKNGKRSETHERLWCIAAWRRIRNQRGQNWHYQQIWHPTALTNPASEIHVRITNAPSG